MTAGRYSLSRARLRGSLGSICRRAALVGALLIVIATSRQGTRASPQTLPAPATLRKLAGAALAHANSFHFRDAVDETYYGLTHNVFRALGDIQARPFAMRFHLAGRSQTLVGSRRTRDVDEHVIEIGAHSWTSLPSTRGRWTRSRSMSSVVAAPASDPLNFALGVGQVDLRHVTTAASQPYHGVPVWQVRGTFHVSTYYGSKRFVDETVAYVISRTHPTLYAVALQLRDPVDRIVLRATTALSHFGERLHITAPRSTA